MPQRIEYTEGQLIGECIFIRDDGNIVGEKSIHRAAIFRCQCGKEFRESIGHVKVKNKTSCGCGVVRHFKKRKYPNLGLSGEMSEYSIWSQMKDRCLNHKNERYEDYGGRGISVFEPWINSFDNFYAYVGPRPSINHSLDRYPNVNGNYEPGNLRWATQKEQMRNTRDNHILEYNGISACIAEWAERTSLKPGVIWLRINRGLSVEDALYPGRYSSHGHKKPLTIMPGDKIVL